jgi:hypothetical protein
MVPPGDESKVKPRCRAVNSKKHLTRRNAGPTIHRMADELVMFGARVSPEFHVQLKVAAATARETMQDLIVAALVGEMKRRGFEPPKTETDDGEAA